MGEFGPINNTIKKNRHKKEFPQILGVSNPLLNKGSAKEGILIYTTARPEWASPLCEFHNNPFVYCTSHDATNSPDKIYLGGSLRCIFVCFKIVSKVIPCGVNVGCSIIAFPLNPNLTTRLHMRLSAKVASTLCVCVCFFRNCFSLSVGCQ